MSRFVHIALVSLVSALCSAAQARTVRSIPEAKTLTHADFVSPVDFELRGILLSAPTEYRAPSDRSIVIEQNGQRLMLHTSKERPVKIPAQPGDTVVLRGQTEFRNGIYDRFRIDNVETLEHGAPPPHEHATVEEILGGFHNLKIVTVRGEMSAVFNDEIDDNWHYWKLGGQVCIASRVEVKKLCTEVRVGTSADVSIRALRGGTRVPLMGLGQRPRMAMNLGARNRRAGPSARLSLHQFDSVSCDAVPPDAAGSGSEPYTSFACAEAN